MKRACAYQGSVIQPTSWVVLDSHQATRLDAFVRSCLPHLSWREIRRAIGEGNFCVNRVPGKKGDILFAGDVITFRGNPDLLVNFPLPSREVSIPICFEDESILILDKPPGLATHGFSGRERNAVVNFLMAVRPSLRAVGKSRWEPGIVHRLDRGTSGLLLVAKDQDSFEKLRVQFEQGLVRKRYWALVWGTTEARGEIRYPLAHDPAQRGKMAVVDGKRVGGQRAKRWMAATRFRTVCSARGFSLLQVELETGVTHQIRAHLQSIGHPLVGDPLYPGDQPDPFGLGRQFLHAYYLGFSHPRAGSHVAFESELPADLKWVLDHLGVHL